MKLTTENSLTQVSKLNTNNSTMKYLLNRDEINIITEKAVDWDKSALGILTNAVLSPISWLAGSIKTGIKKSQLNGLALQWGLEYVKALQALDKNITVKQDGGVSEDDVETTGASTDTSNSDEYKITDANKQSSLDTLKKEMTYFESLNNAIKNLTSWAVVTNSAGFESTKKTLDAITDVELSEILHGVLPKLDSKYSGVFDNIESANEFIKSIKNNDINGFLKANKINGGTDTATHLKNLKNKMVTVIADFTNIDNAYKAAIQYVTDFKADPADDNTAKAEIDFKIGNEYIHTDKNNKKTIVKLLSLDYALKAGDDKIFLTDDDIQGAKLGKSLAYVTMKDKNVGYAVNKNSLSETANSSAKSYNKYIMIKEAAAFKIPSKVEDLMSQDDLSDYKNNSNIKVDTFPKINLKRLDTIKYEANYILNKSKDPKSSEKNIDLMRVWELGIKNVNDYFQDVIDVNKVMTEVKGVVDNKVEQIVADNSQKMDRLQKLGVSEAIPAGAKFNINKLYAFDGVITGQNNKTESTVLMMSPAVSKGDTGFVEVIDGDKNTQVFWFKLLGSYDYDLKSNKIVRKNIFSKLTQNKEIINNFNNIESAYYVAMTSLRADPAAYYFEVYSNKGKYFFNDEIVDDVDMVADEIRKYRKDKYKSTRKEIASASNFFKLKINQRFSVDDNNVESGKYPGIQTKDLTTDVGFEKAKANHVKLQKLLR